MFLVEEMSYFYSNYFIENVNNHLSKQPHNDERGDLEAEEVSNISIFN